MKRIIPTLVLLLVSLTAISQDQKTTIIKPTKKGNYILGGYFKVNYKSSFYELISDIPPYPLTRRTQKTNSLDLSVGPNIGYFIMDGLTLGLSPTFFYSTSFSKSETTKDHFIGIGSNVFIKYYFENSIFFGVEGGYLHEWQSKNSSGRLETKANSYSFVPSVGYAIFLNSNVSIEPKINYEFRHYFSSYEFGSTELSRNEIFFSIDFTIFIN